MVTAIPMARSVMTVRAPFATDRSARSTVTNSTSAKKPAATRVSHIGKLGECNKFSIDVAHVWFMLAALHKEPDQVPRNHGKIPSVDGELAFLRHALEGFRRTFDSILAVVAVCRQLPDHFVGSTRSRTGHVACREIDGLSDDVFVLQHPAPSRDTRILVARRCPGEARLTPAKLIAHQTTFCQTNRHINGSKTTYFVSMLAVFFGPARRATQGPAACNAAIFPQSSKSAIFLRVQYVSY